MLALGSEVLLKVFFNCKRLSVGTVAFHRLTVLVHQELAEVPFDEISQCPTLLVLEVLEQRVSLLAIDVDLGEHVKLCVVLFRGKLFDLRFRPRLLTSELVTGESQDPQTLGLSILGVQSL